MAIFISILITIIVYLFWTALVILCFLFLGEMIKVIKETIDAYKRNLTDMN